MEELTKQAFDFKNKWYGLSGKAEGLTKFKSGFDEGFKEDIKAIYEDIDLCKDYVDRFESHLKKYFPDKRTDITWMTKKVFRHFEDLRVMAKKDSDILEGSKDLGGKLKALKADLATAEAKFKEAENKSGEACRKYFDMKNEYAAEYQSIDGDVKKKLDKIEKKFFEMTTPIIEGHDITISSRTVSIKELFELLSEKPKDVEKISLVVKKGGIFGKKAEVDVAKTSVLKYVTGEILEGVPPILKEKKKRVDTLKAKYTELPKLESACENSEKSRKKFEQPVDDLRAKIGDVKKSDVFKFVDYDGILEAREHYIERIGGAEKEVKEYLDFALVNFKGFVELETDVEKRQLLSEIKGAKITAVEKEKEAAKAREDLSAKVKELTKMTASKEGFEKKLSETQALLKTAESDAAEKSRRLEAVSGKVKAFESSVQAGLKNIGSTMTAGLSDINKSMQPAKGAGAAEKEVEKKVENLRGKKK